MVFESLLGVKIVSSHSLTFKKCLDSGIGKQADKVKKVSENASKEYKIELALEEMQKEWDIIKLEIIPYKNTKTYTMQMPDGKLQMLDDHILLTQELSRSSFKGIFEEPLINWERSLIHVKTVFNAWTELQKYIIINHKNKLLGSKKCNLIVRSI